MSPYRRAVLALVLIVPAAALAALPGPLAEDREQNRRDLAALQKKDPQEYARLLREARAFLALPEERRQRLVQLDRDLHEQPAAVQARLLDVLRRYADWLEALPPADRQAIADAPTARERLRRIRATRERQWLEAQPRAVRERLAKLEGKARADEIARLRLDERQRRLDWKVAGRFWDVLVQRHQGKTPPMPCRLGELDIADQLYVQHMLRPLLSAADWEGLEKAQGQWPRFPRLLVELADAHPMALDGPRGPTRIQDLPQPVQRRLKHELKQEKGTSRLQLRKQEGRWPDFAVAVTKLARAGKITLPPDFWPSRREDLSEPVKRFLKAKLEPALDDVEKALLKKAEGAWPAFPRMIQDLAGRHFLTVPWQTFPPPRSRWDNYRLQPVVAAPSPAPRAVAP